MKSILISAFVLLGVNAISQIEDFEEFIIDPDSALFGQDQVTDGDTLYEGTYLNFENNYNSAWGTFGGWAVSNVTDNTTPGYGNQFSAITGSGDGSDNYGICYVDGFNNDRVFISGGPGGSFKSLSITNTTYAYNAMLNGDSFSKKFGEDTSATGVIDGTNGEDWFLLTIYGLGPDSLPNGDSVNFYLADYQFADDADDYIIDEWTIVDLEPILFGHAIGLDFKLTSSDTTGGFGSNTPAYFAVDNIELAPTWGIAEQSVTLLDVHPNPSSGQFHFQSESSDDYQVYSASGLLIGAGEVELGQNQLDLSMHPNGIYTLKLIGENSVRQARLVKQD